MNNSTFYKHVIMATIAILVVLVACRFTMGGMSIAMALIGGVAALMQKSTVAVCCFIIFPLISVFNYAIIGLRGITLLIGKFAFGIMAGSSLLSSGLSSVARERLPIRMLFVYIVVACVSSIGGWMPLISYLKILNFVLMLLAIYMFANMMQNSLSSLYALRVVFMAMSLIMIVGSVVTYFVPSIGFSMMTYRLEGMGILTTAEELLATNETILFNGMTCHSQMLSPIVASLGTWVLCDMLLIERRFVLFHSGILACIPILLYLSRSRGGFLMLVCVIFVTLTVTVRKARFSMRLRRALSRYMILAVVLLIAAGVYFQAKNGAISRWLRKTEDVQLDNRTLEEAFTGSRQMAIELNLRDFRLNPIFGKGFQVVDGMKQAYESGMISWFSASVEKGVTPYVILGETGIMGALAFMAFLCAFYSTCFRRNYMSLMTNFTCFLVANLADSTFFSPSGLGGFMWVVSCIGAFSTDCLVKQLNAMNQLGEFYKINR